jgi:hypothetical protein
VRLRNDVWSVGRTPYFIIPEGAGYGLRTMIVNVSNITSGAIEATSPGASVMAGISITYSGAGSSGGSSGTSVVYAPGQCTIYGMPGAPMYQYPGGPQVGQFVAGGPVEAKQRTVYNGMDWYMIQPEASMGKSAHVGADQQSLVHRERLLVTSNCPQEPIRKCALAGLLTEPGHGLRPVLSGFWIGSKPNTFQTRVVPARCLSF